MSDDNYSWDQVPLPDDAQQTTGTFFAYPDDIEAYRRAKEAGATEQEALRVGDNGRGRWGSDTTTDDPQVALPPADIIKTWGSIDAGKDKQVDVYGPDGKRIRARVTDIGPHGKLDLNPGATKQLFPGGASSSAINQGKVGLAWRPADSQGDAFSQKLQADISSSPTSAGPVDPSVAAGIVANQEAADSEGASDSGDTAEPSEGESPSIVAAPSRGKPLDLNLEGLVSGNVTHDDGTIKKYDTGLVVNRKAGIMTYVDPSTNKVYQADQTGKWMDVTPAGQNNSKNIKRDPNTGQWIDFSDPSNPKKLNVPGEEDNIDPGATGEDALQGLTPEEKTFVRRIATYQQKAPSASFRNPRAIKLLGRVAMYNPNYSEQYYGIDKDFASTAPTKPGGQIVSTNTAIRHLGEAYDAFQKLENSKLPGFNNFKNFLSKNTGNPDVVAYNAAVNRLGPELAKAFTGNVPALETIRGNLADLSAANSPAQAKAVLTQIAPSMLLQRLDEVGSKYEDAMGKPYPNLLHSEAAARVKQWGLSNTGDMATPRKTFTSADGKTVSEGDTIYKDGKPYIVQPDGSAIAAP